MTNDNQARACRFWVYAMEACTMKKRDYWITRYDSVYKKVYKPRVKRLRPIEDILED